MSTTEALNRFLARQPILTAEKQLFGYEILSRYGPDNYCRQMGTSQFHVNAMDELFLMGIRR
jgi:c-di-GMP-related signal transduction protein